MSFCRGKSARIPRSPTGLGGLYMPNRPKRPCGHPGCPVLISEGSRCENHKKQETRRYDEQRGTAHQRGYTARWQRYSKWFLRQSDNVFCKLQLPGCSNLAGGVDHIVPPNGPRDPLFWEPTNHQSACIHCNSVKGRRVIKGEAEPFSSRGGIKHG